MRKHTFFSMLFTLIFMLIYVPSVNAIEDKTPPVIEDIKILTPTVAPGQKVTIQVTVSDDVSGLKSAAFMFYSPSETTSSHAYLTVQEYEPLTNTYTLQTKSLSKYAELGEWKLVLARVTDYANNERGYYSHIKDDYIVHDITFTVDNSIAVDEEPSIDDGFTSVQEKKDVALTKEWTINFSLNIDIATLTEHNIYVMDSNGNRVPLMFIIDREQNLETSKLTIAPLGAYKPSSTYTLYIKDIIATTGQTLKKNAKMKFTTETYKNSFLN